MVGVIWFVQLVHYPLLAIIGLPMAVEGVTTLVLLVARPDGVDAWLAWAGAIVLAVVLAATVFLSVPLHERMATDPDATVGRRLVATNWPRTVGWTLRGVIAGMMLAQAIRHG
jgi:hypothetical protein